MIFIGGSSTIAFKSVYQENGAQFSPVTDAGGVAGDLMITFFSTPNNYSTSTPSGWTSLANILKTSGFDDLSVHAVGKVLNGTETSDIRGFSSTTGTHNSTSFIFSGINTFTTGGINSIGAGGNPASVLISASSGTPPLIVFGGGWVGPASCNVIDPFTFSTTATATYTSSQTNLKTIVGYKIYNSSPADTTIDMDDEGPVNVLLGFYIGKLT